MTATAKKGYRGSTRFSFVTQSGRNLVTTENHTEGWHISLVNERAGIYRDSVRLVSDKDEASLVNVYNYQTYVDTRQRVLPFGL